MVYGLRQSGGFGAADYLNCYMPVFGVEHRLFNFRFYTFCSLLQPKAIIDNLNEKRRRMRKMTVLAVSSFVKISGATGWQVSRGAFFDSAISCSEKLTWDVQFLLSSAHLLHQ
jgi:hypothetical protein